MVATTSAGFPSSPYSTFSLSACFFVSFSTPGTFPTTCTQLLHNSNRANGLAMVHLTKPLNHIGLIVSMDIGTSLVDHT